jgi:patatin-related protein
VKTHEAELRLALVCYGGVSLAVYMHGVTKELHKLLRAARKFDEHPVDNPFDGGTEAVYFDALTDIAETGPRLMVSIDIISGTSAGGINGIALSKAIARNASLEPLKKVWIDEGDIRKLLRGTGAFGPKAQLIMTVARQLTRLMGPSSPLRGEYMSTLLLQALTAMDANRGPEAPSLLPGKAPELELYVPTTDLNGYDVLVPSGIGGASNRDRDYRQVLAFRGIGGELERFGEEYTPDLAFAGRATSSFPGAFAPVSLSSFKDEAGKDVRLHPENVFLVQDDSGPAADAYFVDGGVLDNAPFDLVVDAIARRRAQSRVYRQLIYIEPDPGQALYAPSSGKPAGRGRQWLKDVFHTLSTVRGSHPILAELTKLRDMNWRIAEVQAIAEQQQAHVEQRTKAVLKTMMTGDAQRRMVDATTTELVDELTSTSGLPPDDVIRDVSDKVYDNAQKTLGATWSTYQRLKFEAVLKRLADEINETLQYPKPSAKAGFVAATLIAWARQHPAWQHGSENTEALGIMLRDSDMPYRERRLVFILARINELYDPEEGTPRPPVGDIDALKAKVWSMIAEIREGTLAAVGLIKLGGALDFLRLSAREAVVGSPEEFARDEDNKRKLQLLFDQYADNVKSLSDDSAELLTTFRAHTAGWRSAEARDSLLNRYLGFALWDGMLFPTISLSELPQLSPIPVAQFSPLNATTLKAPLDKGNVEAGKLKGIPVHHFAAFFQAEYRENDYLWGRLDGAELILRMLYGVAKQHASQPKLAADEAPPHLKDALAAVLETEQDLSRVKTLREHLAEQVSKL